MVETPHQATYALGSVSKGLFVPAWLDAAIPKDASSKIGIFHS
jgi:hypothetical protein